MSGVNGVNGANVNPTNKKWGAKAGALAGLAIGGLKSIKPLKTLSGPEANDIIKENYNQVQQYINLDKTLEETKTSLEKYLKAVKVGAYAYIALGVALAVGVGALIGKGIEKLVNKISAKKSQKEPQIPAQTENPATHIKTSSFADFQTLTRK